MTKSIVLHKSLTSVVQQVRLACCNSEWDVIVFYKVLDKRLVFCIEVPASLPRSCFSTVYIHLTTMSFCQWCASLHVFNE